MRASATEESVREFVGTWALLSIEALDESGDWGPWSNPLGGRPSGVLMYDDNGNMAVQITSEPRSLVTPPDWPDITHGYVAYYGRYEVDAAERTVTHHRTHHINPTVGQHSVVRDFRFDGDRLTLTVAPERAVRLTWARVH